MSFATNIAVEQGVIVAVIVICAFYIYTLTMYKNTRSMERTPVANLL